VSATIEYAVAVLGVTDLSSFEGTRAPHCEPTHVEQAAYRWHFMRGLEARAICLEACAQSDSNSDRSTVDEALLEVLMNGAQWWSVAC
jgi:hypothetical protein